MTPDELTGIHNFRQAAPGLATSGQPPEAAFASMAAAGYGLVINLALHDDPRYSLPDEPGTVQATGMEYVHIPVQFAAPTRTDLDRFMDAMDRAGDRRTWVHCAANMRVTAFIGLYRCLRLGWAREDAFALMRSVWQPNPVWAGFIEAQLATMQGGRGPTTAAPSGSP